MVENAAYEKGLSTKFSDWVGAKIDKTRQSFGLETGMDARGFESSLDSNLKTTQTLTDADAALPKGFEVPKPQGSPVDLPDTKSKSLFDKDVEINPNQSLVSNTEGEAFKNRLDTPTTYKEAYPDREIVNVPVGQKSVAAEDLSKFGDYNKIELETKNVYRDELTDEQFASLKIDDTKYYSDFQNNKIDKTQKWFDTKYKNADGTFTDDYSTLTKDKFDMQMLRQDAGAIAKPASFVGSMLAPEETPQSTGSQAYIAPLGTDVADKQYQQGAERAYAEYGYKGPNTLGGFHMEGAFGNTPINYFQQGQRTQSTMTTALPSLG